MKKTLIALMLCFLVAQLHAQELFIAKGKIEFEKKRNMYREIESMQDDDDNPGETGWIDNLKKMVPNFKLTYFDLYFDNGKTLYKPGREVQEVKKAPDWFDGPATDNIIYNDFQTQKTISQKSVYDNTFLIDDSSRHINWRITNDTRTIAGFECRKAVGVIMDSVYVIAFYTDQILTTGGPESFSGLPGMILGVAIPRINTTWFATKLEVQDVNTAVIAPPKKGKKITEQELQKTLQSRLKDWGKYGKRNLWNIMI